MQFWSRVAAMLPIELNNQGIVDNLTENNKTRVWVSRRIGEDQLYLVHVQRTPGIGLPTSLVVKYFQNMNPTPLLDDSVKNRCKSEMILLASISHNNIINVLDVIERDEAVMLAYKYEVNGNLGYWLHQPKDAGRPLSWPERRTIAIGVAKGLCHLHHGCNKPIVHHNISSHNILLDQNFKAVIASFGAAQMNMVGLNQPLPIAEIPVGNFGYAAPEYGTAPGQLTEKVDIYSFGVVLLELVTGRVANGAGADGHLAIWAQDNCNELMANHREMFMMVVDREIPDRARYMEEMVMVFRLGVDCTARGPHLRPSMQMVLKRLRRGRFHAPLSCYLL
ncbi:unnamed protein product [Triticum turgidum subsp. durum]|uniref:Protein kinase domain-containing protein n=1 Tax=Triticum turgidum subsp. durum TaxID=4567 RepID=A0A9R0W600_TRITD|nr:unnamed protein product [Triticum turgidum subsp. durum]